LCVDHEFPGVFSADWALPGSIPSCGHEGDEGAEVKALSMDALIASDWSLDDVPCEWIVKVDDDLVDFDVVVGGLHQSLDVIGRLLHSLLTDDLLVELVHSQSLHEVYGESEGEVILDFSVGNLLLCEGPDFQAESHLFQYAAICLISLIVDVLGDNDGVILALLETGVDL
jgi:hypothetical protein